MNTESKQGRENHCQVSLSRRQLLLGATVSLATATLLATVRFPVSGAMRHSSIADFHFNEFAALYGTPFRIYHEDESARTVKLTAVKATTLPPVSAHSPRQESFSLTFCAPKGRALAQGTYRFAHPQLGYFDLFIVPTQPATDEERYIAIINRIDV